MIFFWENRFFVVFNYLCLGLYGETDFIAEKWDGLVEEIFTRNARPRVPLQLFELILVETTWMFLLYSVLIVVYFVLPYTLNCTMICHRLSN